MDDREKYIAKAARKRFNSTCGMLLVYLGIMTVVVFLNIFLQIGIGLLQSGIQGLDLIRAQEMLLSPDFINRIAYSGIGYIFTTFLCLLLIRLWKGNGFLRSVAKSQNRSMSISSFFQIFCVFMGTQFLSSLFSTGLEFILNQFDLSATRALEAASGGSTTITMFLYVSIFAPVTEELLFRGAVLHSLKPYGKRFAILFSALLFGIFHGNVIQIPYAFLVGLVLGYVALEYSIWWSVLLHFINNCIFGELLSFFPSLSQIFIFLFFIAGIIILVKHARGIRTYRRQYRIYAPAAGWFFGTPCTIILLIYCIASAVVGIQPNF